MEKLEKINQNKVRSLNFIKMILNTLIILSTAVIVIVIFIYIIVFNFPHQPPRLLFNSASIDSPLWEIYYYLRDLFLPTFIIPSALCIVILTPIRMIVGRRIEILIIELLEKNPNNLLFLYKLKNNRNFRDFQGFENIF